ncbi:MULTISPECIES: hypothetical protein [unclassified Yoonia]|uniref:hypothetical protein n=1 Tax=unclassified Yoonia TaxID=2629118 RepID=UPI002AFEB26C|nr:MULTISPECIES: hypothetical protein [unclassified Yoonia]
MKSKWISLRSIKQHEFRTTLRHIKAAGANWDTIYTNLGRIQDTLISKLIKSCSFLFIYYLLLSSLSNQNLISINFQGVTATVPTAFLTIVASVSLYITIMQVQSIAMIIIIRAREGLRLSLRGFSTGAYGFFNEQDEMHLAVPVMPYGSFKEVIPISAVLSLCLTVIMVCTVIPIGAFAFYLFELQTSIIFSNDVATVYRIIATVGNFIVLATALYILLFNIPFPMRKHSEAIRWGFLVRLYKVGQHPQLDRWLK